MRILRTWLAAGLLLALLCGCAAAEETETIFALERDGISFTILGQRYSPLWGYTLDVCCRNDTEQDLTFTWVRTSVMDMMLDPLWAVTLDPGTEQDAQISFSDESLQAMGIASPDKISFTLAVYPASDWTARRLVNEECTIYPGITQPEIAPHELAPGETVLEDNDKLLFTVEQSGSTPFHGYVLQCYLENRTEQVLIFSWENVTVNGASIDPFWAAEIAPGKRTRTMVSFPQYALNNYMITSVEEVAFTLSLTNAEDWIAPRVMEASYVYKP